MGRGQTASPTFLLAMGRHCAGTLPVLIHSVRVLLTIQLMRPAMLQPKLRMPRDQNILSWFEHTDSNQWQSRHREYLVPQPETPSKKLGEKYQKRWEISENIHGLSKD